MILDDFLEIKISKKNIDHYLQYYTDIKLKDIIKVKPIHLQKNSNLPINVSCDICGLIRKIKYQAFYKNINSCEEHKIYTCDRCSHIKIKSHNRKKWGVDYFSQTEEYSVKFKNTMIKRYGVEYTLQSNELREKVKNTNIERYGVENPFMDNDMIKSKFKEKWGVDHPSKLKDVVKKTIETKLVNDTSLSSDKIREKIKETNFIKYNGHPMKSTEVLNKLKSTNLKKYGHEFTLESINIREKSKLTNLEKYGIDNPMKSEKIRSKFIISNDPNYIKYIGEGYSLFFCKNGHEYLINIDNYHSRLKNNIPFCTVCNPIGDSQSIKEKELSKYILSIYNGEIISNYRDGLEIDIYLPELKIGFEFNGLYWHSDEWKDRNYHLDKTNYFKEKGIRIIHIWEDDWDNKQYIVKSQIRNWLGLTENKIFARNCKVKLINNSKISSEFLNANHIQGKVGGCIRIGLYYNDELVSLMLFDHFEGRKKMEEGGWNLSRFCNKLNTNVIGGASKILKYFIKEYKPIRIVSYSDKNWSNGNLYIKLGFNRYLETNPDYKYLLNGIRVHKSRLRKSRLNTTLSEGRYMKKCQIYRIWDCGKIKWELLPHIF